ncbi:MAG TPA: restriction endonuclease [Anaerolineales bacterium]|nr:restriction endonuclease [Anaerolineales bacterium]
MPKPGHRAILDGTLLVIMALLLLGGLIALGFLENVSKENRALIVMIISVGTIGCFGGLLFLSTFRRWWRRRIWLRAMSAWKESSQAALVPNFVLTNHLDEEDLKQLAVQIYIRLGYRITRGSDGLSLKLINPDGGIELVACKQQPDLIKLHHVYSLELEMKRVKAVRGFFWAPEGFTSDAREWAVHRSIVLADGPEIGRLVDCAHAQGSRFLEY